jgi:ABC-2 type transport system ATP-binding protein
MTQEINRIPDVPAIAVSNLVKRYPKSASNAVDGVSFEVPRGEIFGLLGPNGAGKTTTIGVLTTFVIPSAGTASVMGINVAKHPLGVKPHIAVVPQQSNLDRALTVREVLTFHGAYYGVPRKVRDARADKLLDELGLGDRKHESVKRYSGGMAQRVMIARALMHEPDILFLDEPTNNLDPQTRLYLWERIRELNASGVTVLLCTHDMEEADRLCNRIAIMDNGKLLVNDHPDELKKLIAGGTVLVVQSWGPPSLRDSIQSALTCVSGVTRADISPNPEEPRAMNFRVYSDAGAAVIGPSVQAVLSTGAEVRDLSVKQPTLEEVFILVTGRNIRQ